MHPSRKQRWPASGAPFILRLGLLIAIPLVLQALVDARPREASGEPAAVTLELLGQDGGPTMAVQVVGDLAYIGEGPRVVILDVADPANPEAVGQSALLPGAITSLRVRGEYAYVAAGPDGHFCILNVANAAEPSVVACHDTPGSAEDVSIAGEYAYLADGDTGLGIISISNPGAPADFVFFDTPGSASGVATSGDYAYVADGTEGLRIIDISDPQNPSEAGFHDGPADARDVALYGFLQPSYALVADSGANAVHIFDVGDPANPEVRSSYDTPGAPVAVVTQFSLESRRAYIAEGEDGLEVMDFSDPENPTSVGAHDTPALASGLSLGGDYAYVADYNGLRIVDRSVPTNLQEAGSYDTSGWVIDVEVKRTGAAPGKLHAYLASFNYSGGFRILDVDDPAAPEPVGYYNTPGIALGVAIAGAHAYVADYERGLRVVDVSDPLQPDESGFFNTPGHAVEVVVGGGPNPAQPVYAYVADYEAGLRVVDVSDPAQPDEIGFFDTAGAVADLALVNDSAYVADWAGGLRIMNVAMPAAPQEVGFLDPANDVSSVAVRPPYAYVGQSMDVANDPNGAGRLSVVDVSNLEDVEEAGYVNLPDPVIDVALAGGGASGEPLYAFVTSGDAGLFVFDVSDPAAPTQVGFYNTPGRAYRLFLLGDLIYLTDVEGGLLILGCDGCPAAVPTPTPTATSSPAASATATGTPAGSPSPSATGSSTPAASATATGTGTVVPQGSKLYLPLLRR